MLTLFLERVVACFAEKLGNQHAEYAEGQEIGITIEGNTIFLTEPHPEELRFHSCLGMFQEKPEETLLQELAEMQFLGIKSKGVIFSLDKSGSFFNLHYTCPKHFNVTEYLTEFEHFYVVVAELQKKIESVPSFLSLSNIYAEEQS